MSLNIDSKIYSPFQVNILHVGPYFLKESLSSNMKESIGMLIKNLNSPLLINLNCWDKW